MSGSPRSGTTFVAESLLRSLGGAPLVWEPLQDQNLERINIKEFCIRPVWQDISESESVQKMLNSIFISGKINYYQSYPIDLSRVMAFFNSNEVVLIKFTRGNGIINSIIEKYPNVIYGFLVLRNPFALISSQKMHHEFKGHPAYSMYSTVMHLAEKAQQEVKQSHARDLAITWCCDYLNAFKYGKRVYYYEELIDNFQILLNDIYTEAGIELDMNIDTTRKSSTFKDRTGSTNYRDKFKKNLSKEEINDITKVIELFGINYPY